MNDKDIRNELLYLLFKPGQKTRRVVFMVRILLALVVIVIPPSVHSEDIKWAEDSTVHADINCDGIADTAIIGYSVKSIHLMATFGGKGPPAQSIGFELGMSERQDALCGTDVQLSVEDMDYDLIEIFGENPEGFKQSKTCMGLRITSDDCDSIHIFWNHRTGHIDWWRL